MSLNQTDSFEFLELLVRSLPENVYWKDTKGRYLGCNDNMAKMAGYTNPKDIIGKTDAEFSWRDIADQLERNDAQVIASGVEQTFEETALAANGQYRIMHSRKVPLKDLEGRVIGILGISYDVTDENIELIAQIYQQVTGQEYSPNISLLQYVQNIRNYLEKIISLMPGNVYWKTKEGMFLGCNDNQAEVFNLSSRYEVLGKNDRDFVPNDLIDQVLKHDQEVIKSNKEMLFEETGTDLKGNRAVYLSHKVPLHDQQNNLIGVLGISLDITHQKNIENELRLARDVAQSASLAKTDFIRNMSHDIRTPLTGIIGMAEVINREPNAAITKEGAQDIHQAAFALLNLLNEIIETAQLESGELMHKKTCFNLKTTIDALLAMFKPAVKYKRLTLESYYDDNIPELLFGHELLLHRIILNLLGNAVKFTHKGSVSLEVSLLQKRADKVSLKIVVKDTGIGIPVEKQNIIFEKFSRLTPSYENQYKGSGLGLYMVKQFIEKLGGDIKVSSTQDKGTQFTCTVQFKIPTQAQLKKYQLVPQAREFISDVPDDQDGNILLVEDNELVQKTTVFNLKSWGYGAIDLAEGGKAALDKTLLKKYDLIYLDLGLPDLDGQTVAAQIRHNPQSPNQHTPIIALTAHADQRTKQECLASQMNKVLTKPLLENDAQQIAIEFLGHTPQDKIIDWALWLQRSGSNADLAKQTQVMILKKLPEIKTKTSQALEKNQQNEFNYLIHQCYSDLAYCGLPQLEAATESLEQAIRTQQDNQIKPLYQKFCDELDRVLNHNR